MYLIIKLAKTDTANNTSSSEMAVLVNRGAPAGLRLGQNRLHLTLQIKEVADATQLSVALHAIETDGKMRAIGDGSEPLVLSGNVSFTWQDGDDSHEVHIEPRPYTPGPG